MKFEASIEAVTVFTQNARITRRGKIAVEPGQVELLLSGLPGTLIAESLRVQGRGTAQARLLGVELRKAYYTEPQPVTVLELTQRLRELQAQDRELSLRLEVEEKSKAFLSAMLQSAADYLAKGFAYGRTKVEESAAMLEYARSNTEAVNARLTSLEREREELSRRIEQTNQELANANAPRSQEGYEALVGLEVGKPGEVELELTYMVSGASWSPLYDLRLMEGEGDARLEVGYLAEVAQRTGETWQDVELTLSTARTQSSAGLPKLNPWHIREAGPYPPPPAAPMALGAGMMRAMAAMPARPEDTASEAGAAFVEEMEELAAETSEAGPALTYRVPRRLSVPSDGSPRKATIARLELAPKLDYITAPKLAEEAHRRAKVTNSSTFTFLPGQANVFWGDEFVGRSALKNIAPGQEFELSLGVDERIQVERKPIARSAEKVLLRDVRRSLYGYEIKVTNLTSQAQRIVVRDQIPLSANERVAVRLDEATPQPHEKTSMGLLEWQLQLEPGKESKIAFVFSVEQPRNMRITGLPE